MSSYYEIINRNKVLTEKVSKLEQENKDLKDKIKDINEAKYNLMRENYELLKRIKELQDRLCEFRNPHEEIARLINVINGEF